MRNDPILSSEWFTWHPRPDLTCVVSTFVRSNSLILHTSLCIGNGPNSLPLELNVPNGLIMCENAIIFLNIKNLLVFVTWLLLEPYLAQFLYGRGSVIWVGLIKQRWGCMGQILWLSVIAMVLMPAHYRTVISYVFDDRRCPLKTKFILWLKAYMYPLLIWNLFYW